MSAADAMLGAWLIVTIGIVWYLFFNRHKLF